jgi:branched-subunit amino acid ABC-type transport system permease component
MRRGYGIPWLPLLLAAFLFFFLIGPLFAGCGFHHGGWGMMRPEVAGGWHHGPWSQGGHFGPPVGLFMGLGFVFRLVLAAALIGGGIWLFRRSRGGEKMRSMFERPTCQHCGQTVKSDWNHCPNCGLSLTDMSYV